MPPDQVPLGAEEHEHPRGDIRRSAVALVQRVGQLRPQPRLVLGQLRPGRAAAPRVQGRQHARAELPEPPGWVAVAHPADPQVLLQLPTEPLGDVIRARRLHDRHEFRPGTTNIVRRMPSIRTRKRSLYMASSTWPALHPVRAHADRYTVTGSVACSAIIDSTASATEPAAGVSRCRATSRARRCAALTVTAKGAPGS